LIVFSTPIVSLTCGHKFFGICAGLMHAYDEEN
jgi:hypothetical protein